MDYDKRRTIYKLELIEEYIKENKISVSKFCKKCKMGYLTYKKIMNGKIAGTVDTLFNMAKILGLDGHQLINEEFDTKYYNEYWSDIKS